MSGVKIKNGVLKWHKMLPENKKMMSHGGLKCMDCGGLLQMDTDYDELHENAKKYGFMIDGDENIQWGCVVYLICPKCNSAYPVCRTPNMRYVSDLANESNFKTYYSVESDNIERWNEKKELDEILNEIRWEEFLKNEN